MPPPTSPARRNENTSVRVSRFAGREHRPIGRYRPLSTLSRRRSRGSDDRGRAADDGSLTIATSMGRARRANRP